MEAEGRKVRKLHFRKTNLKVGSPFWEVDKLPVWSGSRIKSEFCANRRLKKRTVGGQEALGVALREREPTDGVDLLLDLHRSQEVEFTIVALELCVKLIGLFVRLLLQDDNLTAVVADSQVATGRVERQRRDPVGDYKRQGSTKKRERGGVRIVEQEEIEKKVGSSCVWVCVRHFTHPRTTWP